MLGDTDGSHPAFRIAFHIGFHKTATTWLQREILTRHPDIVPYLAGAPWDDELLRMVVTDSDARWDADAARAVLARRIARLAPGPDQLVVVSAERLSGHLASGGADAHRTAGRLAQIAPHARIWFVRREPEALLRSEYRQLVGEGYPGTLDRLRSTPHWKTIGYDPDYHDFDALEARYAALFGAERVRVWDYDRLREGPQVHLAELADFLGIAPWQIAPAVLTREVHPGLPESAVALVRFLNRFRRSELNPHAAIDIGVWWRGPIVRVARALERRRRSSRA